MIPIRNICHECLNDFNDGLTEHPDLSGVLNVFCEHRKVLLATEVTNGIVSSWLLSPASSREQAQIILDATLEQWRREVPAILQTASKKH